MIRVLSRLGVLVGTVASAQLPALLAVTAPDAGGTMFGPQGLGNLGGAPGEQDVYPRLSSVEDAARTWDLSQELAGVTFP